MTLPEMASKFDVYPNLISKWKQEAVKNLQGVFEGKVKSTENRDNSYDTVKDKIFSIGKYIWDYNNCRPHSSFKNRTPNEVYKNDFVLI